MAAHRPHFARNIRCNSSRRHLSVIRHHDVFNTKITRNCDDVVENASSPSPFHVRAVPVDLYRPVSPFRWFQIRGSARECTGHDRNLLSPSPRVVRLSALFVAAVQSYRRQCVVLRCPNRHRAIRNHASNRRWSGTTVARAGDVRIYMTTASSFPNPSMSGRSPYNASSI